MSSARKGGLGGAGTDGQGSGSHPTGPGALGRPKKSRWGHFGDPKPLEDGSVDPQEGDSQDELIDVSSAGATDGGNMEGADSSKTELPAPKANPYVTPGGATRRSPRALGRSRSASTTPVVEQKAIMPKIDEALLFKQVNKAIHDAFEDYMASKPYAEKLADGFKSSNFDSQIAATVKKVFGDRTKGERATFAREVKTQTMLTHKEVVKDVFDNMSQGFTKELTKQKKVMDTSAAKVTGANDTLTTLAARLEGLALGTKAAESSTKAAKSSTKAAEGGQSKRTEGDTDQAFLRQFVVEVGAIVQAERAEMSRHILNTVVPVLVDEMRAEFNSVVVAMNQFKPSFEARPPTTPPNKSHQHRRRTKRKNEGALYSPTSEAGASTPGSGRGGRQRHVHHPVNDRNTRTTSGRLSNDGDGRNVGTRPPVYRSALKSGNHNTGANDGVDRNSGTAPPVYRSAINSGTYNTGFRRDAAGVSSAYRQDDRFQESDLPRWAASGQSPAQQRRVSYSAMVDTRDRGGFERSDRR